MSQEDDFRQAMQADGIDPPAELLADGALHRFSSTGDRSKNCWYILFADDPAAGKFGCWKRGIAETWCSKGYQSLDPEEKARYTANMEAAKRQRDADLSRLQADCRAWCADRWKQSKNASDSHPYLQKKGVHAYGLKVMKDSLMVPLYDTAGNIQGMQFIQSDGNKTFKTGTAKQGSYYPIGKPKDNTLLICEGYATGASLHEATAHAVAVAFDAGNLKPVAEALRAKYPTLRLIICADNDQWSEINTGVVKATEAARAVGGMLTIANIPDNGSKPTDFNDLHRIAGIGEIRRQIEAAEVMPLNSEKAKSGETLTKPNILDDPEMDSGNPENSAPVLPFTFRRLSDVQAKPIRWLWPGRFARGKVAMLAGHPGLGKSQLTASLAAVVTTGGRWPVDKTTCEQGNVIFFSAEDDAEDTIRPRLEAAGADLDRVYILDAVLEDDGTRPRAFNMATDLLRLGVMLKHIGNVALIVIDPITAYLGGTDSHKNSDIRALLSPLGELAAKHGAAVVCVSHLNKGGSGEALMRVTGSLAFVAAARAAFLIARDKEDKHRRLFLPIKNNIGNDESGLAFCVESHTLDGGIETSRINWEAEAVTISADEAMAPQGNQEERSALDDAKEFLTNLLSDGPVSSRQLKGDAEGAGIAWRTIQRAQKVLGIEARKEGMKGPWLWSLPAKDANYDEERQANNVAAFAKLGNLRQQSATVYPDDSDVPELLVDDLQAAGWLEGA